MKHWWERNGGVSLGEHTREVVEDFTGRIPLLLDKCVQGDKINLDGASFLNIYASARIFEEDIRKLKINRDDIDWARYATLHLFLPLQRH